MAPPLKSFSRNVLAGIAATMASKMPDVARALPDSFGGEDPKSLLTFRTEVYTFFTAPGPTQLLYSAQNWVRIKLTLETAGPVVVGQRADLSPVLSGKGRQLDTNVEFEVYLPKGTRFYIISGAVNRVSVTIEPVPWMDEINSSILGVASAVRALPGLLAATLGAIIRGAEPPPPTSSAGNRPADLPMPPPKRGLIPRLTGVTPLRKNR